MGYLVWRNQLKKNGGRSRFGVEEVATGLFIIYDKQKPINGYRNYVSKKEEDRPKCFFITAYTVGIKYVYDEVRNKSDHH